jgi:hypothetical protein
MTAPAYHCTDLLAGAGRHVFAQAAEAVREASTCLCVDAFCALLKFDECRSYSNLSNAQVFFGASWFVVVLFGPSALSDISRKFAFRNGFDNIPFAFNGLE